VLSYRYFSGLIIQSSFLINIKLNDLKDSKIKNRNVYINFLQVGESLNINQLIFPKKL